MRSYIVGEGGREASKHGMAYTDFGTLCSMRGTGWDGMGCNVPVPVGDGADDRSGRMNLL